MIARFPEVIDFSSGAAYGGKQIFYSSLQKSCLFGEYLSNLFPSVPIRYWNFETGDLPDNEQGKASSIRFVREQMYACESVSML